MNRVEATEIVQKIQDECKKHDECFDCPFCVDEEYLDSSCIFTASDEAVREGARIPIFYNIKELIHEVE